MSEALETLKYFKSAYNSFLKTTNDMFCQITISREQANEFVEEVEAVEKKVKALEIIKKKSVWVGRLKSLFRKYNNNLDVLRFYNANMWVDYQLTKEEFNLLKEVLE